MNTITRNEIDFGEYHSIAQILFKLFENIEFGSIEINLPDNQNLKYMGNKPGKNAQISISNWKFVHDLFMKGDIGLGESYINEYWSSDSIEDLIEFGIQNDQVLRRVVKGSVFKIIYYRIKHLLNRNTKKQAKENIKAHYDIGNDFYSSWLDRTMTYSSALFNNESDSLEQAQLNKYDRIISELGDIKDKDILEIGCGWGGFLERSAEHGAKTTGITISEEQLKFANKRLENHISVNAQLCDYREIEGQYDYVVSIEMFEALGYEYWDTYFKAVSRALKAGGRAVIQVITMNDNDFKEYQRGTDFIQQYIFPGGMLASVKKFRKIAGKNGLNVVNEYCFGKDYAKTLNHWEKNFKNTQFYTKDPRFSRLWKFYLKYCEGAFNAGKISVYQFTLEK